MCVYWKYNSNRSILLLILFFVIFVYFSMIIPSANRKSLYGLAKNETNTSEYNCLTLFESQYPVVYATKFKRILYWKGKYCIPNLNPVGQFSGYVPACISTFLSDCFGIGFCTYGTEIFTILSMSVKTCFEKWKLLL